MPNLEPSQAIQEFFRAHIFAKQAQHDLVFAIKSSSGASVNIDGPFIPAIFDWSERKKPDEYVIQPEWAARRDRETSAPPVDAVANKEGQPRKMRGESKVHVHLAGALVEAKQLWVRLWYAGTDYIDHDVRICFFTAQPPTNERGDEIFWFYAFADGDKRHPLCEELPALHPKLKDGKLGDNLVFSELRKIG